MASTIAHPVRVRGRLVPPAVAIAVLSAVATVAALLAVVRGGSWPLLAGTDAPVDAVVGASHAGMGALVLAGRRGSRRLGWLLVGMGVAGALTVVTTSAAVMADEPTAAAGLAVHLQSWLWVPAFVPLLTLVPLLYPNGQLVSPRWRAAVPASGLAMVLLAAGTALHPQSFHGTVEIAKPWTSQPIARIAFPLGAALLSACSVVALTSLAVRLRRSAGLERRQVVVLLGASAVVAASAVAWPLLPSPAGALLQAAAVALPPVAIAVAVTRHRLYDLDLSMASAPTRTPSSPTCRPGCARGSTRPRSRRRSVEPRRAGRHVPRPRLDAAADRGDRWHLGADVVLRRDDSAGGVAPMTRVLVVDDHPLFRDGVVAALLTAVDLDVVREAGDVASAVETAVEVSADVVMMDLQLPDGSGIDATRALLARRPEARVLVMTMSDDDEAVVAAMRAGARGYVIKGASRDELLHAVRTVAAGGAAFSPTVADRLGSFFGSLAVLPGRTAFPTLTDREREVLELVARGYDNRRIARELFLSDKTVRNYVSNVLTKLDVEDRAEAMARARNAGLGG